MPRRCVFHIGHAKTATTYLQHCLHLNEAALRRHGWWVPGEFAQFGSYDYVPLSLNGALISGNLEPVFTAMTEGPAERIAPVKDYMFAGPADCDILLSSELLFYYPHITANLVNDARSCGLTPEIIAYLPRQDRGVIPGYLQNVRGFALHSDIVSFLLADPQFGYYHYLAPLLAIRRDCPTTPITLRTFDPAFLTGGNVFADLLALIGCPLSPSDCTTPLATSNQGLTLEHYELIRAAGLLRRPDIAAHLQRDIVTLTAQERARTRAYYYRPSLRLFLAQSYMPDNLDMIRRFMLRATEAERDYWQRTDPIEPMIDLDDTRMRHLWRTAGG